jgi:hypothetical protein
VTLHAPIASSPALPYQRRNTNHFGVLKRTMLA